MDPLISIIIPCTDINDYTLQCISYCKQLNYEHYEIILLPDKSSMEILDVKIIQTGNITPGAKRNIGITHSKGSFCAFLDSDAYPDKNWLINSLKYFDDPDVGIVGGPGLTPTEDDNMQRISGYILSSFMVGSIAGRYKRLKTYETEEVHSCNLITQKSLMLEVDGWNETFWPGEDSILCYIFKTKIGKKIIQANDVVVYHHRRPFVRKHLIQISKYGFNRGVLIHQLTDVSFGVKYFIPSIFTGFLFIGVLLSAFYSFFVVPFFLVFIIYSILCLMASYTEIKNPQRITTILITIGGIFLTHIFYGVNFITGYLRKGNLDEN
jgi:glycosyltransferase involved in cell wall biosynthesis|tara:strand:- start:1150 stop:2118 length:969 start_codon:yes stop_codon:yes gene_type:complete